MFIYCIYTKYLVEAPFALITASIQPNFAELDVFLGQHILLTLKQHFNPKM